MKLCWLIPDDKGGGVVTVASQCCQQATKAGYEVTLLLLVSPTWIDTCEGFQVATLGLKGDAPEAPIRLYRWLKENPQDILFFNGCREFDSVIPYLQPNLKCIYVVHDTARRYWKTAIEQEDCLEAVVAVSETVANKFQNKLKNKHKLVVIYNGCAFPELAHQDIERKDEIIFMGGQNPTKGAFDTIKLWEQLDKIGFKGKLHWFGDVSLSFEKKVKKLVNSHNIIIHGHVHRDVIFSTAATAKVFLMLSRVEPFGMVTIEAMSMGCIPVAWDINTGTREIIKNNETGLFSPLGDTLNLAVKVSQACNNHEDFRVEVTKTARSKFNDTIMWQNYETLINRIKVHEPIIRNKINIPICLNHSHNRNINLIPSKLKLLLREFISKYPKLGYLLRDFRR